MTFDLDSPDVPDDVVRSVAAEITGGGLKPLTDDERTERERWREQQRRQRAWADEQRRMEHEHRQAESEAIARAEHAAEVAERNRKARLMRAAQIERQSRAIELRDLRQKVTQQGWWQTSVDRAIQNRAAYEQRQTLVNELERAMSEPKPAVSGFAEQYRNNQRSGLFYDDTDE